MHFLCCKCVSITTRTSVFMGEKGILMGFSSAIYVFLFYLFFTYYVLLIFTYYVLLIFYLCFTYFLFILIILTYSYSYYFLRIFYLFLRLILSLCDIPRVSSFQTSLYTPFSAPNLRNHRQCERTQSLGIF